jgi:hypothetical protein
MFDNVVSMANRAASKAKAFVSTASESLTKDSGYVGQLIINIPKKELASRNITRKDMVFQQHETGFNSEDFEYLAKLLKAIESIK